MISSFLPTVFRLLALNPNRAIDDALARSLALLDDSTQEAACQLLMRRGHQGSLTSVVSNFRGFGDHLKKLLAANAEALRPVLHDLLQSTRTGHSMAAVDLLCASSNPNCIDLLGEGLFAHDSATRESAARGLRRMVEIRLAKPLPPSNSTGGVAPAGARTGRKWEDPDKALIHTLSAAIRRWESHEQTPALEAALWMCERLHEVFRDKLNEPRTTITRALSLRIQAASDPRVAGFLVRALAIPSLRAAAVRGISKAEAPPLHTAILEQGWLLADPQVARGARQLRDIEWLGPYLEEDDSHPEGLTTEALRWLFACGIAADSRVSLVRRVLDGPMPAARRDAFWLLSGEMQEKANEIISAVAERRGDPLARVAARAVRRYRRATNAPRFAAPPDSEPSGQSVCEGYWQAASDRQTPSEMLVMPPQSAWLVFLRGKLSSSDAADRLRALGLIQKDGILPLVQEQVLRLAHDPDSGVRARAVQLLPAMPTATAGRVARTAASDPDPRVQANAVEALERMDQPDRAAVTLPKLESPHQRIRANAVKSLLKLELEQAAEALLAMLEDPSPAHRLSALWVIQQLNLRSLTPRLRELEAGDPSATVRRKCVRLLSTFEATPAGRLFTHTLEQRRET